jgi:nucleoside-diphosphate-sugar epimerase
MDLRPATLLVTGANGFVGGRIVDGLTARASRVLALARRPGEVSDAQGVEEVVGDFADQATAADLAGRADAIVHCAAAAGDDLATSRRVNRDGTRTIARAALGAGCRLVHISTISVYDRGGRDVIDEDTPLVEDGDPYSLTKAEAEREIAAAVRDGLDAVVLRPPAVLGWAPTSMWGQTMPERIRDATMGAERDEDRPFPWVHVDDLADAVVEALEHDATGAYNVVGGVVTWGRYASDVRSWFGAGDGTSADATAQYFPGDRIARDLGFRARRSYEEAMTEAADRWR